MKELHEGHDDGCCQDDSYKGDFHVLGHTISLINLCWLLVIWY
jgi:hypothetical protein